MSVKTPLHAHVQNHSTPQSEPVPGAPTVPNSAGGYAFVVDDWARLDRFLILGSEGGTYYVTERALTRDNAAVVSRCLDTDPARTVARIASISEAGRAPKNEPAVFALALAACHDNAKGFAFAALARVCRTGTHLFQFVAAVNELRGWGSGLRAAVARWYTGQSADALAYQLTKYQQRNGWSHRDVLRLCSAKPTTDAHAALLRWTISGIEGLGERTVTRGQGAATKVRTYPAVNRELLPESVQALESLRAAASADDAVALIERYADKAPRELVPTQFLAEPKVWGALLPHMPMTATLRNLGAMTRNGLLAPLSEAAKTVCARLRDVARLKKARVHPLSILVALKTYQQGHGVRATGDGWVPVQDVVDALNDAFYLAFDAVEPTNKRWVLGIDVSGSMTSPIAGMPVSCCEAATALALVAARVEPYAFTGRFNTGFEAVPFGKSTRLDAALAYTQSVNGGGTDCSLPMVWALKNKVEADVFCVLTDSETWAGNIHPFQALRQYREKTGIAAKLIVAAMTSTGFTIADPSDAGMLDIVGFSTDTPPVMADFAKN